CGCTPTAAKTPSCSAANLTARRLVEISVPISIIVPTPASRARARTASRSLLKPGSETCACVSMSIWAIRYFEPAPLARNRGAVDRPRGGVGRARAVARPGAAAAARAAVPEAEGGLEARAREGPQLRRRHDALRLREGPRRADRQRPPREQGGPAHPALRR